MVKVLIKFNLFVAMVENEDFWIGLEFDHGCLLAESGLGNGKSDGHVDCPKAILITGEEWGPGGAVVE